MSRIRKAARGQACMVRIPGVCNFNPETTVLAHINGAGIGKKAPDFQGAFCCSDCHDVIDERVKIDLTKDKIKLHFWEGVFRTQELLFHDGLITTAGSR